MICSIGNLLKCKLANW